MSNEESMHKTGWANIELPPHLTKAREEQERLNQENKDLDDISERISSSHPLSQRVSKTFYH